MGFPRLHAAHSSFTHAPLLMTGRTRPPLGLLRAPFLANLTSLSWGMAFLDVPERVSSVRQYTDAELGYVWFGNCPFSSTEAVGSILYL